MKCLCKKDFSSKLIKNFITKDEIIFFEKNKYYEYEIEMLDYPDEKRMWIIYDRLGVEGHVGVRFHTQKNIKKITAMYNFFDYFYNERAMKLIKIKESQNEKM